MYTRKVLAIGATVALVAGCDHMPVRSDRPMVTLESAICSMQNALINTARPEATRAGLKPAEATVTLAIGFKETNTGKVGAKLKIGIVEWGPEVSRSFENSSANTISIKFVPGDTHYTVFDVQGGAAKMQFSKDEVIELPECKTETF